MRVLTASAIAVLMAVALYAGQSAPQGDDKLVKITGCLGGGPSQFVLTNATEGDAAEKKGGRPAGAAGVVATYELTPRDGVSLAPHLGHRVELTGVITGMSKGGSEAAAQDRQPTEGSPETAARRARSREQGLTAQFSATAIKMVSPLCLQ